MHELLHCAGLFHEQSRKDRDDYVVINWGNIVSDKKHNFEIASWSKDIGPYNYDSIMHYHCRSRTFSIDPNIWIIWPKQYAGIGQRIGLSAGDVSAIEAMYYDIDPNRGKPNFPAMALPSLNFDPICTHLPPTPATSAQCAAWSQQLLHLEKARDASFEEDIFEWKRYGALIAALRRKMSAGGCG